MPLALLHLTLRASALALFVSMLSLAQSNAAAEEAQASQLATQLAKMHRAWGPALNSPGASITLKESSRDGALIRYRIYAKGFPKDAKYVLLNWPVTQAKPSQSLSGVTLDNSGMAVCAGTPGTCGSADAPNDPIDLALKPTKGEPFRVALSAMDSSGVKAFVKIVPIPNEASDNGCHVQSVVLMPGAVEVAIEGSGFPANAKLEMVSQSGSEKHGGPGVADADGNYFSVILPNVKGADRGSTMVTLKSEHCHPTVNFDWGKKN